MFILKHNSHITLLITFWFMNSAVHSLYVDYYDYIKKGYCVCVRVSVCAHICMFWNVFICRLFIRHRENIIENELKCFIALVFKQIPRRRKLSSMVGKKQKKKKNIRLQFTPTLRRWQGRNNMALHSVIWLYTSRKRDGTRASKKNSR